MLDKQTIACLGPQGTHTEAATIHLFPHNEIKLYPTILSTLDSVANKEADLCVVPIENSIEGSVNITLDNLVGSNSYTIINELVWPIRHHLMSIDENSTITEILSHPQAIAQCRKNITKLYPNVKIRETHSTSEAAKLASENPLLASISPYNAAKIYNLAIRHEGIQDLSINCTRFITVSPRPFEKSEKNASKISIVCELDGEKPGTLYELLREFALQKINLVRIESRPARTILGRYIFFLDLEGSIENPLISDVLKKVTSKTLWLKILGSYPVIDLSKNK